MALMAEMAEVLLMLELAELLLLTELLLLVAVVEVDAMEVGQAVNPHRQVQVVAVVVQPVLMVIVLHVIAQAEVQVEAQEH
jgi:hypothetical protein